MVVVVLLRCLLLLLLLILLTYLGYVVIRVGVSGGAVEGIVAAVVPGLAEHVVGYLQALVPGAGRFQERQRLSPALRHLSLCSDAPLSSPLSLSSTLFLTLSLPPQWRASGHDLAGAGDVFAFSVAITPSPVFGMNYDPPAVPARMRSPVVSRV